MCKPDTSTVAVVVATDETGKARPVASYTGSKAEAVREQALSSGVAVTRDPDKVRELLREQGEKSCIPVAIYDLMSAVIDFAQDLDDAVAESGLQVGDEGDLVETDETSG